MHEYPDLTVHLTLFNAAAAEGTPQMLEHNDSRWVDILAAKTGWTIRNLGANGREIPGTVPDFPPDTDLLIVMLGTNDLLQGHSPEEATGLWPLDFWRC